MTEMIRTLVLILVTALVAAVIGRAALETALALPRLAAAEERAAW